MKKGTGHLPAKERARLRAERAERRALGEKKTPARSGLVSAQKQKAPPLAPTK